MITPLIIINIIFFIVYAKLLQHNRTPKFYKLSSLNDLGRFVSRLVQDFNNQILKIEIVKSGKSFSIQKYQANNLWGLKLKYDIKDLSRINDFISSQVFENLKILLNGDKMIIDFGNKVFRIQDVISFLITNELQISADENMLLNFEISTPKIIYFK